MQISDFGIRVYRAHVRSERHAADERARALCLPHPLGQVGGRGAGGVAHDESVVDERAFEGEERYLCQQGERGRLRRGRRL